MSESIVIVTGLGESVDDWSVVAGRLRREGITVTTVATRGDALEADAERVTAALASAARPVVVAHAYGSAPATVAVNARNAARLVFVGGLPLDYGESFAGEAGGVRTAATTARVEAVGWRAVPSTCVVCSDATSIAPAVQRRLAQTRAETFVELTAGDAPFRTQANGLATLLCEEVHELAQVPPGLLRSA